MTDDSDTTDTRVLPWRSSSPSAHLVPASADHKAWLEWGGLLRGAIPSLDKLKDMILHDHVNTNAARW